MTNDVALCVPHRIRLPIVLLTLFAIFVFAVLGYAFWTAMSTPARIVMWLLMIASGRARQRAGQRG